jgi:hypothetical protein
MGWRSMGKDVVLESRNCIGRFCKYSIEPVCSSHQVSSRPLLNHQAALTQLVQPEYSAIWSIGYVLTKSATIHRKVAMQIKFYNQTSCRYTNQTPAKPFPSIDTFQACPININMHSCTVIFKKPSISNNLLVLLIDFTSMVSSKNLTLGLLDSLSILFQLALWLPSVTHLYLLFVVALNLHIFFFLLTI